MRRDSGLTVTLASWIGRIHLSGCQLAEWIWICGYWPCRERIDAGNQVGTKVVVGSSKISAESSEVSRDSDIEGLAGTSLENIAGLPVAEYPGERTTLQPGFSFAERKLIDS